MYCNLSKLYTIPMQRMSQTSAKRQTERTIHFSQHRVTVGRVSGRPTVTDGPSRKPYQSFAKLPQSEGAETRVNLSNEDWCGIDRHNINAVPKKFDTNSTFSIAPPTE